MKERDRPLTPRQELALLLLADKPKSTQTLEYDHPGMRGSAYGVVMRLARRGLVDLAGWDSQEHRTYMLTDAGEEAVEKITRDPDEDV